MIDKVANFQPELYAQGRRDYDHDIEMVRALRANRGVLPGEVGLVPCMILTTVGANSLRPRVRPVAYVRWQDSFLICGSVGGSPKNPSWYFNLRAHPYAIAEVGDETLAVRARLAVAEERGRLYKIVVDSLPIMAHHQDNTERELPIFVLEVLGRELGPPYQSVAER